MHSPEAIKAARREFCFRLRDIAKAQGLTQEQIAEKTGLQRNNISRIFSGKYSPSLDMIILLWSAMGGSLFLDYKHGIEFFHPKL